MSNSKKDNSAIDNLKDTARVTGQKIGLVVSDVSEKAGEITRDAQVKISANPLKSVAIAFGTGLLAGFILKSRK